jgi:hypothetical protein
MMSWTRRRSWQRRGGIVGAELPGLARRVLPSRMPVGERNGFPVIPVVARTPRFGPAVVAAVVLLDVNVLLAWAWPTHIYHGAAHRGFPGVASSGWASCPLTQLRFVRLSM